MDDLISRADAVSAVENYYADHKYITRSRTTLSAICEDMKGTINALPSAQPEQPSEIQDILNYLDTVLHPIISPEHWNIYSELHDMISTLPSAQPEEFEWCTDCKEYDQERHCCPRWTKVIRNTVAELKQPQWIPCSERLPKHDETVLVWYRGETRIGYLTDISETDFSENDVWVLHGSFPFKHDEKKVVAWMSLPEPYEVEK